MAAKPKYRVLKGINYPPNNKRAEVGDVVTDLPEFAIKPLLKDGTIELVPPTKAEREKLEEKKANEEPETVTVERIIATPDKIVAKEEEVEL